MAKIVSLTLYPASAVLRARLERQFDPDVMHVDLSSMRRHGYFDLLKILRTYRCETVVVPVETLNDQAIMPVVKAIAAVVPARQRVLLLSDDTQVRFGVMSLIGGLFRVLGATIRGLIALALCHRDAAALLKRPRIAVTGHPAGKNVAYLYGNFTLGLRAGGAYGHIAGVSNALMDRGYGLDFYFIDDGPPVRETARFHRIALPDTLSFPLGLNQYWSHRLTVARMRPELSAKTHAFIYQRLCLANFVGVVLSRAIGVPLIVEYNGSDVWGAKYWGYGLHFEKTASMAEEVMLKHAHLIVTISDPLRDELIARGIDPARIVTYPNGVDPVVFDPERFSPADNAALRATLGIDPGAKVVTFVGTFGRWHGAEILAAAIRDLVTQHAEDLRRHDLKFVWVGDGLTMSEVREILADPACDEFVRFTGTVVQREGPRYLAISDICIAPHVPNADGTKFFGSPTKLFEYMVMGKPTIASDLDQIGEVLQPAIEYEQLGSLAAPSAEEARLAILITPGNAEQLARSILFLAENPDWIAKLGSNSRAKALKVYTWKTHVDMIMGGFERVLELKD